MDGINFLFRLCLYAGIALSIPVIVYQFLRYLEPLFTKDSRRLIMWGSMTSGVLALAGMAFGYFIGLPAALHFLLHQFVTDQIEPLLTIQAYMSFVTMYMLVSALLFQVPLFLIFTNRIKPLQPKKLLSLRYERWVIVGAFVLGALMNPDPNLLHQVVIVGPLIIMYQIGVGIVWLTNHGSRYTRRMTDLHGRDAMARADRERRSLARTTRVKTAHTLPTVGAPAVVGVTPAQRVRQGAHIDDFVRERPYRTNLPHVSG